MKFMKRRVALSIALLLLCALMLPYLVACSDKKAEEKPEKAEEKKQNVDDYIPVMGGEDVDSLASTPNKGDGTSVVSGGDGVKSAYSQTLEDLENALKNASTTQAQIISMRRNAAEQYMREMLTVKWTPKETIHYGLSSATGTDYTFHAGRVYSGIPYTNGSSGLEAFRLYTTGSGTLTATFAQKQISGSNTAAIVGADEIDALIYAWNTVSDTIFAQSQADMIPINGFLFLGDYVIPQIENYNGHNVVHDQNPHMGLGEPSSRTLTYDKSLAKDTDNICAANGRQTMYAAYAKLLKADGLIRYDDNGTGAYMAVSVDVKKNSDGSIAGNSTVTVLRQTNDLFAAEKTQNGTYLIGEVDKKVTFKELFDQNFIPMTITEFKDGTIKSYSFARDSLNAAKDYVAKNLYAGFITTSQRVVSANMVIYDASGKVVTNFTTLSCQADLRVATENRYGFDVTRISGADSAGRGVGTLAKLSGGKSYRCVLTLNMVGGKSIVARDFTFTA